MAESRIGTQVSAIHRRFCHCNGIQLIVFKLGSEEYALHIDQIKEVVLTPNISQIPQTPDYIKGVANIRGNIIAIMDLEQRFGLVSEGDGEDGRSANYSLVVESEKFKIGILVKEVPNTLAVNASEIDSSANIIQSSSIEDSCINGIVKMDDRMIIMVDMFKMMETQELKKISETVNR